MKTNKYTKTSSLAIAILASSLVAPRLLDVRAQEITEPETTTYVYGVNAIEGETVSSLTVETTTLETTTENHFQPDIDNNVDPNYPETTTVYDENTETTRSDEWLIETTTEAETIVVEDNQQFDYNPKYDYNSPTVISYRFEKPQITDNESGTIEFILHEEGELDSYEILLAPLNYTADNQSYFLTGQVDEAFITYRTDQEIHLRIPFTFGNESFSDIYYLGDYSFTDRSGNRGQGFGGYLHWNEETNFQYINPQPRIINSYFESGNTGTDFWLTLDVYSPNTIVDLVPEFVMNDLRYIPSISVDKANQTIEQYGKSRYIYRIPFNLLPDPIPGQLLLSSVRIIDDNLQTQEVSMENPPGMDILQNLGIEEIDPPKLLELWVDQTTIDAGSEIIVKARVEEGSYPTNFYVSFVDQENPDNYLPLIKSHFTIRQLDTRLYEITYHHFVHDHQAPGVFAVRDVAIWDSLNNFAFPAENNLLQQTPIVSINNTGIVDQMPPEILSASFDKAIYHAGETAILNIRVKEVSSINHYYITLKNEGDQGPEELFPSSSQIIDESNQETIITYSFSISEFAPGSRYFVNNLYISDPLNNAINLEFDSEQSPLKFEVIGGPNADRYAPIIREVTLNNDLHFNGNIYPVEVLIEEDRGITNVWIQNISYQSNGGNQSPFSVLTNIENVSEGIYQAKLDLIINNEFWGEWGIDQFDIIVEDLAGNRTVHHVGDGKEFILSNRDVYYHIRPSLYEPPIINQVSFDKESYELGDLGTIYLNVTAEREIQSVNVQLLDSYIKPSEGIQIFADKYEIRLLDDGTKEVRIPFHVTDRVVSPRHTISSISVRDQFGNSDEVYRTYPLPELIINKPGTSQDMDKPRIVNISFDKEIYFPFDPVTLTMLVEDESWLDWAALVVRETKENDINTDLIFASPRVEKFSGNTYLVTYHGQIPPFITENTEYGISELLVQDSNGNYLYLKDKEDELPKILVIGRGQTDERPKLIGGTFDKAVYNDNDNDQLRLTLELDTTPTWTIRSLEIEGELGQTETISDLNIRQNELGQYEIAFTLADYIVDGSYSLKSIVMTDTSFLFDYHLPANQLTGFRFESESQKYGPRILEITSPKTDYLPGEDLIIDLKVEFLGELTDAFINVLKESKVMPFPYIRQDMDGKRFIKKLDNDLYHVQFVIPISENEIPQNLGIFATTVSGQYQEESLSTLIRFPKVPANLRIVESLSNQQPDDPSEDRDPVDIGEDAPLDNEVSVGQTEPYKILHYRFVDVDTLDFIQLRVHEGENPLIDLSSDLETINRQLGSHLELLAVVKEDMDRLISIEGSTAPYAIQQSFYTVHVKNSGQTLDYQLSQATAENRVMVSQEPTRKSVKQILIRNQGDIISNTLDLNETSIDSNIKLALSDLAFPNYKIRDIKIDNRTVAYYGVDPVYEGLLYEIVIDIESDSMEIDERDDNSVLMTELEIDQEIPFELIVTEASDLAVGQQRTLVEGANGILRKVYQVSFVDGKELERDLVSAELVKPPIARVVAIGIKQNTEVIEDKPQKTTNNSYTTRFQVNEMIAYETIIEYDQHLLLGTQLVVRQGSPGTKVLTYEVKWLDNVETSRQLLNSQVQQEPISKIIRIGTKVNQNNTIEGQMPTNASGTLKPINEPLGSKDGNLLIDLLDNPNKFNQISENPKPRLETITPVSESLTTSHDKLIGDKQRKESENVQPKLHHLRQASQSSITRAHLPNTGEQDHLGQIFTATSLGILAGLGLMVKDKKEDYS